MTEGSYPSDSYRCRASGRCRPAVTSTKAGPALRAEALRLGDELAPDAPLPGARVHDEGQDADHDVVVLEARQGVEGYETDDLAVAVGDHDPGIVAGEAPEAGDDLRWTGRIALVGEERRDPFGIAGLGGPDRYPGGVGHRQMVARRLGGSRRGRVSAGGGRGSAGRGPRTRDARRAGWPRHCRHRRGGGRRRCPR